MRIRRFLLYSIPLQVSIEPSDYMPESLDSVLGLPDTYEQMALAREPDKLDFPA